MIPPLGSLVIAMIKNSAIVGASAVALDRPAEGRPDPQLPHLPDLPVVLLGRRRLPDHHRRGDGAVPPARAALRDAPMSSFALVNWELVGEQRPLPARGLRHQPRDRRRLAGLRARRRPRARAARLVAQITPVASRAGLWVDVFRNLPLIFLILYLARRCSGPCAGPGRERRAGLLPDVVSDRAGRRRARPGSCSTTARCWPRSCAPGSCRCRAGSGEAAAALGMTYRQPMRHVILPQGLRRMVPATVSQLITLNKDTTLVSHHRASRRWSPRAQPDRRRPATRSPARGRGADPQVMIFIGLLFIVVNCACRGCRGAWRSASAAAAARPSSASAASRISSPPPPDRGAPRRRRAPGARRRR